jgi:hypothetical protein
MIRSYSKQRAGEDNRSLGQVLVGILSDPRKLVS